MNISEEQEKSLMALAANLGIYWDEFKRQVENLMNGAVNLWEKLVDFAKELSTMLIGNSDSFLSDEKPAWCQSYKPLKSQVLNRKPMQARARSYC